MAFDANSKVSGPITLRAHSFGKCEVCETTIELTRGKRVRLTCSAKCRRIKYMNSSDVSRRRNYLVQTISRYRILITRFEEELEKLGWSEKGVKK